jgi:predicted porin
MSFALASLAVIVYIANTTTAAAVYAKSKSKIKVKGKVKNKVKDKYKDKYNNAISKFILLSCF